MKHNQHTTAKIHQTIVSVLALFPLTFCPVQFLPAQQIFTHSFSFHKWVSPTAEIVLSVNSNYSSAKNHLPIFWGKLKLTSKHFVSCM